PPDSVRRNRLICGDFSQVEPPRPQAYPLRLAAELTTCPPMPRRPEGRRARRTATAGAAPVRALGTRGGTPDDRFFRHLVSSMRNGVIAIHRDGTLALMNGEAYRIFSLPRRAADLGRPFSEVFHQRPDLIRVLACAFELTTLPNRAELRLKDVDWVIGYTLSQVKDD